MYSIGLMSGTSMDGIDAALIETDGTPQQIRPIAHTSLAYETPFKILLKAAEFAVKKQLGNLQEASERFSASLEEYLTSIYSADEIKKTVRILQHYLNLYELPFTLEGIIQHSTQLHAEAVKALLKKSHYDPKNIGVVGYHGQTFYHSPHTKTSIIVGNGQDLADAIKIPVISDFRSKDISAGGQGAPLAPLYHFGLAVRDHKIPVAVVNCGGIANVTLIYTHKEEDLIAFDTGPGNCLIDRLVQLQTKHRETMDENGKYGLRGKVHTDLFDQLKQQIFLNNYLHQLPPKSLDVGDMQLPTCVTTLSLEDACATLGAFTADTIMESFDLINKPVPNFWILAGGGWRNPVILRELTARLQDKLDKSLLIQTADEAGWSTQFLEAELMAYLAVRSLKGLALSLPNTTKVPIPLSGGVRHTPR